ncbi:diaminopimelate epimerase [Schleiferia thermophila]|uniref:diaminopimelate epimerase n=1 Tax=Schleiferia thermophila TaxID=884107 RepID=UPI003EE89311
MHIRFFKYQGTGNDFIIIDNRELTFPKTTELIQNMCHRKFGIGADGLILLENDEEVHFKMVYYNSDGRESTMCGNGGRCVAAFAKFIGIVDKRAVFRAVDGIHSAWIIDDVVSLELLDTSLPVKKDPGYYIDTGSPHLVIFKNDLDTIDVNLEGRKWRFDNTFENQGGVNVNFCSEPRGNTIYVRTYERGVESETLSCGTGVTAAALVTSYLYGINDSISVNTPGGDLSISFKRNSDKFEKISLTGQAKFVFEGKYWLS